MRSSLLLLGLFFVSIILFSCGERNNSVAPTETKANALQINQGNIHDSTFLAKKNKWPKEIYDSTYGLITLIDTNIVVPMGTLCSKTTFGYSTHHFEPNAGKLVGVWPYEFTLENLSTLRTKWGYSHLFFQFGFDNNSWSIATLAGYTLDKIMISVGAIADRDRASLISQRGNAFAYYVGEPADQDHSMGGVREALIQNNYSSLFVIDGYKRTYGLDYAVQMADKVLFSAYNHWIEILPGLWMEKWPEDPDQRPDWSDMQNRYGNKFSMSWINTKEINEFYDLFGHARNLGLTGVWIYGYLNSDGKPVSHYNDQWENISNAAFYNGFLRKFIQYYRIEWRCDLPDPCACDPNDLGDWYIYGIYPGTISEIFP